MAVAGEPGEAVERLKERMGRDEDVARRTALLEEICQARAAEVRAILPRDEAASIKSAAREGSGRRFQSLAEAQRRGVDLRALRSVQRSGRARLDEVMHGNDVFTSGELTVRRLEAPFDWPPYVQPPAAVSTVFVPPFAEGWERASVREATGAGSVSVFDSYLDPEWGRLGTHMVGSNLDADDSDTINALHQGGYLVPVTMANTSPLMITADLTCLVCEHRITTSDEWGWSDFYAFTQSGVAMAVLWEHDDGVPMVEDFRQRFVPGLDASGDGDAFPGMKVIVGPGERRSLNLLTSVAFPAGKTVWVYLGISDFMFARLDDVSVEISMDSAWQLSSLTATSF